MTQTKSGYLAGIGYVTTTLFSMFFVEAIVSRFQNKFVVLFIACIISTSFFMTINLKSMPKIFSSIINSWRLYILLSILIGINWLCSIFGVIKSNAFLYGLGYFLFSASLAHFNDYLITKNKQAGILFIAAWLVLLIAFLTNFKFIAGFLIAIIGGATGYLYRRVTFAFSAKEHLSPSQIISVRFYPLIFLLTSQFSFVDLIAVRGRDFYLIAAFAIIAFIIPNYLNQLTIIRIGADKSAIISALIFPGSWLIEQAIHHSVVVNVNFILAIFSMLIILIPFISEASILKDERPADSKHYNW